MSQFKFNLDTSVQAKLLMAFALSLLEYVRVAIQHFPYMPCLDWLESIYSNPREHGRGHDQKPKTSHHKIDQLLGNKVTVLSVLLLLLQLLIWMTFSRSDTVYFNDARFYTDLLTVYGSDGMWSHVNVIFLTNFIAASIQTSAGLALNMEWFKGDYILRMLRWLETLKSVLLNIFIFGTLITLSYTQKHKYEDNPLQKTLSQSDCGGPALVQSTCSGMIEMIIEFWMGGRAYHLPEVTPESRFAWSVSVI